MLITTTNNVEGKQVDKYLGIATGEVIIGINFFRDFLANMRDFFGGRSASYERALEKARQEAMGELEEKAKAVGADAIVGLHLDYEVIGAKGSMIMVSLTGTAVKLK
jgi:uncharacterized protein YbjQ (UPF0145 family)